jgi:hypothetical protein
MLCDLYHGLKDIVEGNTVLGDGYGSVECRKELGECF